MKLVLQRVSKAKMYVNGNYKCEISKGIVVFLGITHKDDEKDIKYCIDKLLNLRIFNDVNGKLNLSLRDVAGEILIVSNFTIYGETKKGRRPSYIKSAPAEKARKIYDMFIDMIKKENIIFQTGEFQEHMDVEVINDGPVTLIIESPHSESDKGE